MRCNIPYYDFRCDKCKVTKEIFNPITSPLPTKCDKCGQSNGFYQIVGVPNTKIVGEPRNFQEASDQNKKRIGKEQYQMMVAEDKARIGRGFTGQLPDGMKPEDVEFKDKYITPPWRDGSMGQKLDKPLSTKEAEKVSKKFGIKKKYLKKRK